MRQAPVLPQLFDHIGHHLTPRHSHLVNTGLRVWENTNICLVHRAKLRGELYFFKKANVLLGKVRDFQPSDSETTPNFPCQWL